MKLSISIVNWNTKNILKKCLQSIYESNYKDFEVFVIDNNSEDDTALMVQIDFPEVKIIANNENCGFAKGNNQAIKKTSSDYILILNPDIVFFKDTLGLMVDFMDAHPDCGVMGIKLLDKGHSESKLGYFRKFPSLLQIFLFYTMLSKISAKSRFLKNRYWEQEDTSKLTAIQQVPGACLLTRNKILKETGIFDERFPLFFEDVDLCYRIKKAGWKILYTPSIRAVHIGAQSIGMLPYEKLAGLFFSSMFLYLKKHHSFSMAYSAKLMIISNTLLKIITLSFLTVLSDYKRDKRQEHKKMLLRSLRYYV